jgi:pimeloyl-ACP methyl ester carboxylesterase
VLVGVLVGVLVFVVAAGGFVGWRAVAGKGDSPSTTSTPGVATSSDPSVAPSPTPTAPLPSTDPRLASFYHQKLAWRACGRDQCALLSVPLDYDNPDAKTIRLAVLKVPASSRSARVGALVVNPGGPGGSGVSYAAAGSLQFGTPLSRAYDIVGFDPRGVGQSDPVECLSTKQLDAVVAFDPDPDTAAERTEMDRLIRGFGQGCLDHSGDLTRHVSTKEAARDMDILRAALDEPKLNYLGASYGTFLGATYADLFPTHVGRFVLDGAIDPALTNEQLSLQQAHGFETALRAYVKDCVDQGSCFLGASVDAGVARIQAFLAQVEKKPLPTGDSRQLTEGLAMLGIWMPLYIKDYWGQLSSALRQAFGSGNGSQLLGLADLYTSRGPSGYTDNSMEALYAVNCLDHDDYIPTSQVPSHFAQFQQASPTFGRAFAFGLSTCSQWPVQSGQHTVALHAAGAPPIVVVGTTRDPATPLAWAQALARELDSGRLITRDGDGHTGFQRGNSCVDNAVEAWLIQGKVPKADLHC